MIHNPLKYHSLSGFLPANNAILSGAFNPHIIMAGFTGGAFNPSNNEILGLFRPYIGGGGVLIGILPL